MAKRPPSRYHTTEELVNDLDPWLKREPVAATARPFLRFHHYAAHWIRRRPAAAVALVMTALFAAAACAGWRWHQGELAASVRQGQEQLMRAAEQTQAERQQREKERREGQEQLYQIRQDLLGPFLDRASRLRDANRAPEGALWLSRAFALGLELGDENLQRRAGEALLEHNRPMRLPKEMGGSMRPLHDTAARRLFGLPSLPDSPDDRRLAALIGRPFPALKWSDQVAFHPAGRSVLLCSAAEVSLWDIESGKRLGGPALPPGESITAVFAPDGRAVLTRSSKEMARLWEVPGFKLLHSLPCAAIAPDAASVAIVRSRRPSCTTRSPASRAGR